MPRTFSIKIYFGLRSLISETTFLIKEFRGSSFLALKAFAWDIPWQGGVAMIKSMSLETSTILSYSDAPRNILTFDELTEICKREGKLTVDSIDHRICSQAKSLNKISDKLTEFLFIIDK